MINGPPYIVPLTPTSVHIYFLDPCVCFTYIPFPVTAHVLSIEKYDHTFILEV